MNITNIQNIHNPDTCTDMNHLTFQHRIEHFTHKKRISKTRIMKKIRFLKFSHKHCKTIAKYTFISFQLSKKNKNSSILHGIVSRQSCSSVEFHHWIMFNEDYRAPCKSTVCTGKSNTFIYHLKKPLLLQCYTGLGFRFWAKARAILIICFLMGIATTQNSKL